MDNPLAVIAALVFTLGVLYICLCFLKLTVVGIFNACKRLLSVLPQTLLYSGAALFGLFLGFMPWSLFLLGIILIMLIL